MDNTAQPIKSNSVQPDDSVQPTPTASFANKELGAATFSENIKPSEEEVKVGEELKTVGIVANTDKPKLDEVHEQIGVTASLESVPVNLSKNPKVTLPMTEDEADKTLSMKQSKFDLNESVGEFAGDYTEDSLPFFATLIKKVFKEMHRRVFGRK